MSSSSSSQQQQQQRLFEDAEIQRSKAYIEKNKINELFEDLLSKLVYAQPENPREFLVQELKNLKQRDPSCCSLLNQQDIETIFAMMSIGTSKKGTINKDQLRKCLINLCGIDEQQAESKVAGLGEQITLDKFKSIMASTFNSVNLVPK